MKKILSILGTISLITSGSSNLIACNNTPTLTSEKLAELKKKNNKTINGNKLEWMAPQEKPFNAFDDKWYVVIWRGDKNANWKISKFENNTFDWIKIDNFKNSELKKRNWVPLGQTLCIEWSVQIIAWEEDINNDYFKSVYRWDGNGKPTMIKINSAGEITN